MKYFPVTVIDDFFDDLRVILIPKVDLVQKEKLENVNIWDRF